MDGVPKKPKKPAKPESMAIYHGVIERMLAAGQMDPNRREHIKFPNMYFEGVTIGHIKLANAAAVYMVRKGLASIAEAARCVGVTDSRIADCMAKCRRIHLARAYWEEKSKRLAYQVGFVYTVIDGKELTEALFTNAAHFDCCSENRKWVDPTEVGQYELRVIWQDAVKVVNKAPADWIVMTVKDADGLHLGVGLRRRQRLIVSPNYRLLALAAEAEEHDVKYSLLEQLNKAD